MAEEDGSGSRAQITTPALDLITHVPGAGGWAGYAPLRHRLACTPAQVGLRVLLQVFLGAVGLLLAASTLVGLAVIVRWLVSLT